MTDLDIRSEASEPRSIENWLSEHPDCPENYELTTCPSNKRKRRKARRAGDGSQRRALGDIQPNSMPPTSPTRDSTGTKSTKILQKNATTPKATRGRRGKQPEVLATPRAIRQPSLLADKPAFDPPKYAGAVLEDDNHEDDSSLDSEDSKQNSSKQSSQRALSPRKARAYMQGAEISVKVAKIPSNIYPFPPAAQNLRNDLEALQKRKGLLAQSLRRHAQAKLGNDDEDALYKNQEATVNPEETFSHLQTWYTILDIEGAAEECEVEDCAEASWNAEVHCKILREALKGHWRSNNVWYRDITTAKVFDKELLPKVAGLSAKTKLVDFAIMVRPQESSPLEDALERKCASMPSKTINQTDASYIRNNPIAISMEIKRPAGNEDVSVVELQTWVAAHFNMLKVLLSSNNASGKSELPILPLIQVQGHTWSLWIAEFKCAKNQIIIHRRISLGSTDRIVGIYQIIASVQRLAQWVAEEYQPWWIKATLGLDPKTLESNLEVEDKVASPVELVSAGITA
ncbi:MAG: hypothetical protein Q9208_007850 [Pyrenodesmia sp. 3 TL-2023]